MINNPAVAYTVLLMFCILEKRVTGRYSATDKSTSSVSGPSLGENTVALKDSDQLEKPASK